MNKLSLFKTEDLFNVVKNAFENYDGTLEETNRDLYECYDIEFNDVFENNEHCIDVTILETSTHFPWQPSDVEGVVNNKFRIKIECIR